jgi:penicillin-binding protein 2
VGTDTEYAADAVQQSEYDVALPAGRGDFYDRIGKKLTGYAQKWYALCVPGDNSYSLLFPYVPYSQQTLLYEKRNSQRPFLMEVGRDLSANGIYTYSGEQRYLTTPIAEHLIGYLDSDGHGISGLEKAFDDVLYHDTSNQSISCAVTAQGGLLGESKPETVGTAETAAGVQLTLDAGLQRACEGIAQETIRKGCILVMEASTGRILASVSMPEFDPDNIGSSIRAADTSLINRSFSEFNAGSVFKVVLAAAACEFGYDEFVTECTGELELDGQAYHCALNRAHGTVDLRRALEESCNCYFVELGQQLGAQRVLETAKKFGFGQQCSLAGGFKSSAGNLPTPQELESTGELAMFSFGQGKLTVTPLQITVMMNCIADGGLYRTPLIVEGVVNTDISVSGQGSAAEPTRTCSAETAEILRGMLAGVVEEGIGSEAEPATGGAGGKTGTAQTGQQSTDGELLNYWFSGFWPKDDPRYTITVLQDGIVRPETSSAAIFSRVADALSVWENS